MKKAVVAIVFAASALTAAAENMTALKHDDIPEHVTMIFSGTRLGNTAINVTNQGPVASATLSDQSLATSGWDIDAIAAEGYKTPTFKTCKFTQNEVYYTDDAESHVGSAHVSYSGNDALMFHVYVFDIQVEPEEYTVSFNANGGTVSPASKTVTFDATYGELPTPSRTGHEFVGWWTEPGGGSQVTAATKVEITSSQTLYAHWTPITYTVHFDAGEGSGSMADQTLTYSVSTQLTQNAFTKANYNFAGWTNMLTGATYSDHQNVLNLTNVQSAVVTLTALWSGQTYTVYYHRNYGAQVSPTSDTFAYGGSCTLKAALTRSGYTFLGWATAANAISATFAGGEEIDATELQPVNGEVHLYAVWDAYTYTVAFDANGGEGTMADLPVTFGNEHDTLMSNAFTRIGYTFAGWAMSSDSTTVAYADGGAIEPDITTVNGKRVIIYAIWQPVTYTVAFDANDAKATGEMAAFDLAYGVVTNLPVCAFEKDGYDFDGWTNLTPGVTFADRAVVSNLTATANGTVTLYATWKAQSYVVVFDAKGNDTEGGSFADGTTKSNMTVTVDEPYGALPVVANYPSNRDFGYWRYKSKGVWTEVKSESLVPPPSAGATNIVAYWLRDTPIADALDIPTTQEIPFALDNEHCDTNWTVVATNAVGGTCLSASMPYYDDEEVGDKRVVITGQFVGKGVLTFSWKIVSTVIGTKWTGFYDPELGPQSGSPEQLKFFVGDEFRFGMAATDSLKLVVTSEDDMTTEPVSWTPDWQTCQVQIGEEGVTNIVRWEMFAQHNDATGLGYSGGTAWLDNVRWVPEGGGEEPPGVAVPVLESKVYDGTTQTADVPDSEDYEVVENAGGDNVGTYTVTLTLKDEDNTRWADGEAARRTVPWRIVPKALTDAMVAEIADQEYTGGAITPDVTVTDAERGVTLASGGDYSLSFSGNEDAGEATATVTGMGNYTGVVSKAFTILKKTVVVPEIASKVYNGSAQVADEPDSTEYDVVENNGGTDVGEYDVKLRLRDPANCKWPDAKGSDLVVKFSITKATYDMTGAAWDYAGAFAYDGTQKTVNVSGLPEGVDVASCTGNSAVAPGTYTAHATLSYDTANYYEPSIGDLDWEISANSAWTLHETFADVGEVTSDAAGLKVMLTNDVSGTIELPDNLGNVTIDLNGHDMAGSDGEDADAALTPGGDGLPAILVVAAEGEGAPTTIAITNSQSDVEASVSGGKGGEGTPPGNGGKSVDVADGARPGVSFDIDESIQVADGAGGEEWTRELVVGKYFKMTLVELGYDVPTNGTPYSVVAKGLPSGLKLKYNAAVKNKKGKVTKKAKVEWWIEGVPTAALDYDTNPTYLVITANGRTETLALPLEVLAQDVENLGDFPLGTAWNVQNPLYLPNVTNGWTVSGLPTGLKYTAKLLTTKKKVGKKTVVTTNALPYTVYGKTTKAGLFTITAKKKKGAYYETMKYRMLILPRDPDPALFGDDLSDISSMAYEPVEWDLMEGGSVGRLTLPAVSAVGGKVAKVTGLPKGLSFAATDTYAYKNAKKKTGKYLKQKGQTIIGTPTKTGTYVVTFTKNVKSGKKTVAKTAQILWKVTANDAELSLGFNDAGGVIESGTVGLKYGDLLAFDATSNATVTASGLPKGISLANLGDGNWGLKGFTTKAGTYLVTVKATLKGKTVTQRIALKVDGLPAWAKGTFNGLVVGADDATNGLATVTVSSVGKISGKFHDRGTNWTFSASSYTGYDPDATNYTVAVTAKYAYKVKSGKKTVTKYVERKFALTVAQGEFGGVAMLEEEGGLAIGAWQNLWGSTYKAVGKKLFSSKSGKKTLAYKVFSFDGTAVGLAASEKLSLKVTTAGAVTATLTFDTGKTKKDAKKKTVKVYYKPTCKTVVIPTSAADPDAFTGEVILYFAPSAANAFPRSAGTVELTSAE